MGILDTVFAGDNGVSAMLHRTLGGSAIIRKTVYSRDQETGILTPTFTDYPVPFVPADNGENKTPLNAAGTNRSDVREPVSILSGTFPCSALNASVEPESDLIVYNGIEYRSETAELLSVGDTPVQYLIRGRRS